jgi:hypothetical protein
VNSHHHVRGHYRNGRWVRAHTARNPGRRSNSGGLSESVHPLRSPKPPVPHKLSKPALITVTIVISVIVILGGTTLGLKISSSGSATGSGSSEVDGEGQLTVDGATVNVQTNFKQAAAALVASRFTGYMAQAFDDNCAAHSYGQVQNFFRSNPCKWLARAYIVLHQNKQDSVLVAISWVDMPTLSLALEYKRLVDVPGTGNITELSRESGSYRNIVFTGHNYVSGIVGTAVWNVQVQPIGSIPSTILKTVLNDSRQ